jgi:hypothetical protein
MRLFSVVLAACVALVATAAPSNASATEKFLPSVQTNAPPKAPFASFDRVEIAPVTLAAPWDKNKANVGAQSKIQGYFTSRLAAWTLVLNARTAKTDPPRALLIEPSIEKIKFIGMGARIWVGAMAGSSQVLMKLKITDKQTGEVIAEPEFYQRANAWGGAYSSGGTDSDMLSRITDLVATYLSANLETAAGGPTGAEEVR